MSNSVKTLTPDDQSNISTYLGFARDDAVIACHHAHRGGTRFAEISNDHMLRNLQKVVEILGLELVERHSQPAHVLYSESPINKRTMDQASGETTAAELVERGPR